MICRQTSPTVCFYPPTCCVFLLLSVQLFSGNKVLPFDVLPLYKNVSNLQDCEGLQGDLGAPRGEQEIPAVVTRASANRSPASLGGAGWVTAEGANETLTPSRPAPPQRFLSGISCRPEVT